MQSFTQRMVQPHSLRLRHHYCIVNFDGDIDIDVNAHVKCDHKKVDLKQKRYTYHVKLTLNCSPRILPSFNHFITHFHLVHAAYHCKGQVTLWKEMNTRYRKKTISFEEIFALSSKPQ